MALFEELNRVEQKVNTQNNASAGQEASVTVQPSTTALRFINALKVSSTMRLFFHDLIPFSCFYAADMHRVGQSFPPVFFHRYVQRLSARHPCLGDRSHVVE